MGDNKTVASDNSPLGVGGTVVLGFSGGLDTTYCVKYLTEEKGYEVHSVIVNTGGFTEEELKKVEAHAYKLGVKSHTAVNAVKSYYDKIINTIKNGTCFFIYHPTKKYKEISKILNG